MPNLTLVRAAAVFLAGAVILQGCAASTDTGSGPTSTVAATLSGASSSTAPAGISPLGSANLDLKTLRPAVPSQLVVTDVRVGKHEGFERVVFEFVGDGSPGWFIDYTESPAQQGSGTPIKHGGSTALNVNIDGTTYPFELGMEDPHIGTVKGDGGAVTEVTPAGTFEGRSQFVIGMAERHAYSVEVLTGPTRLVIDILN
ncbi:hypothetical protein [Corynebacterium sp.]|uniref:AMIN-like domain-containing (lipo)protein n=1 Tax=Corynebacterium sp. TaxID=1720 RepID=UPI0026DD4EE5|nr:hypothetical protein [Corynebacterium sp.]MDO5031234.1 hypothetical protein [Corynebacterium sp.]